MWAPAAAACSAAPLARTVRAPGCSGRRSAPGRQRLATVVAQAGGAAAPSAEAAPSLAELKNSLSTAVQAEDYAEAARLRDAITALEAADPLLQLEAQLEAAVREQRFEDAAALRDQLQELRPPPPPPPPPPAPLAGPYDPTAPTTSDTVTDGVRVTCRSFYVPSESRPAANAFFFAYKITIRNESRATVKLVERYWFITNGQGQTQEVRGPGVVGEQPELAPGEEFSYQSACPMRTPSGTMEGHYEFYAKDEAGKWTKSFLVKVGQFALRADL